MPAKNIVAGDFSTDAKMKASGVVNNGALARLLAMDTVANEFSVGTSDTPDSVTRKYLGDATKFCTTQFDAVTGTTGSTLTNIVGLTGFTLTVAGIYKFDISLAGVSTTNCGIKIGFKFTTLTLTSLESTAIAAAAASMALTHPTTATDQASLFASKAAAWLHLRITGRIVVNAAGTLAVQAAQETADADTTSVYVGSWATFQRIS